MEYKTNEIVKKFLLAVDKFMPEMNQDLLIVLADHLLKTKKKFENLQKHEMQTIFTKLN